MRRPSVLGRRPKTLMPAEFTAQPLAAMPPYGCGVPLAGAAVKALLKDHLLLQEATRLPFCPRENAR